MTADPHQEIVRFDIAMNKILHVYVFDAPDHLEYKEFSIVNISKGRNSTQ